MTPSHLVIFLKGNFLWISSGMEVMLGFFFAKFGAIEISRDDCWFHQVWCALFLLGLSEFSFLVNCLGLNLPCLLFFILDSARSCRVCFRFYSIFSFVFVSWGRRAVFSFFLSCGRLSISFLVLYYLLQFDGTWSFLWGPMCRIFTSFRFKSCILMWSLINSYGRLTGYIT